jgi:prepilin-type N-terminal cleavage/methylation domain-containing protein
MRRQAFTLVELLVVIAIIAVLMAMLIPSIQGVQKNALEVRCAANMKQVLNTIALYASQNKDQLPGSPAGENIDDLLKTNALSSIVGSDTTLRKATDCPANVSGGVSYMYNPHPALRNYQNLDWTNNTVLRWKKLAQHPKNRAILIDRLREPNRVSHTRGKGGANWNLGFADGSVRPALSADVFKRLQTVPATAWSDLNDDIRVLELVAQHRDPKVGPGHSYAWGTNTYYPFCVAGEPAAD